MTLSTSATDSTRRFGRTAFVYLMISAFCALFGQVYEFFSHGVYSLDMMFAFAYPLLGGVIPFGLLWLSRKAVYPAPLIATIYHCGIATCTVGCLIRGVLEIYGTTNRLAVFYTAVGIPLLVIGASAYLISRLIKKEKEA